MVRRVFGLTLDWACAFLASRLVRAWLCWIGEFDFPAGNDIAASTTFMEAAPAVGGCLSGVCSCVGGRSQRLLVRVIEQLISREG